MDSFLLDVTDSEDIDVLDPVETVGKQPHNLYLVFLAVLYVHN